MREKQRFSKNNCKKILDIAKARIHVERAIAWIKDFRILNGAFPVTMKDLLDDIYLICAAITNLAPPLVPLWIKMKRDLVYVMYSFLFSYWKPKWNNKKKGIELFKVWLGCGFYVQHLIIKIESSLFLKQPNPYNKTQKSNMFICLNEINLATIIKIFRSYTIYIVQANTVIDNY